MVEGRCRRLERSSLPQDDLRSLGPLGRRNLLTAAVERRSRVIQVAGRLKPRTSILHTAPADGLVQGLMVSPGDRVRAGTLLFSVDRNEVGVSFRPVPEFARISGLVSEVNISNEEEVSEEDPGVTLIGLDGFTLEAKISDNDAFTVAAGQSVKAHTRDGAEIQGTLARRSPEPDYATGLFELTFEFPPDPAAFVGAFVLIDLPTEITEGFFVPRGAIDRRYGRNFLWIVEGTESTLQRREVILGTSIGDEILVSEGLSAGERYLKRLSGREREGSAASGGRP